MNIKFNLGEKERFGELKVRHMRLMQSGEADLDTMISVMSRFMVNEDDEYLDAKDAFNLLDELTINQINEVAEVFKAAIDELDVPKEKGNS